MKKRNEIRNNSIKRFKYFEKKYTPVIYRALQSQIKLVSGVLKSGGVNSARRFNDSVMMNEQLGTAIRDLYKVVGLYFANDTYRNIQEQVKQKGFGFNEDWLAEILNYFRLYLLSKAVVPITETTKEFIRQVLEKGEQEGWGIDKMAYELEHSDLTLQRARLIVRTETAKAAFKGRDLAHKTSPFELKLEWVSAHDHRTRHSHYQMDGVKVNEYEKFNVPRYKKIGKADIFMGNDLMKGPGDPNGSKENVINCRCRTIERVNFNNGEPVMKRQLVSKN